MPFKGIPALCQPSLFFRAVQTQLPISSASVDAKGFVLNLFPLSQQQKRRDHGHSCLHKIPPSSFFSQIKSFSGKLSLTQQSSKHVPWDNSDQRNTTQKLARAVIPQTFPIRHWWPRLSQTLQKSDACMCVPVVSLSGYGTHLVPGSPQG